MPRNGTKIVFGDHLKMGDVVERQHKKNTPTDFGIHYHVGKGAAIATSPIRSTRNIESERASLAQAILISGRASLAQAILIRLLFQTGL